MKGGRGGLDREHAVRQLVNLDAGVFVCRMFPSSYL
jgi:hypothetical protein